MSFLRLRLTALERYSWRHQWRSQVFAGLAEGILGLAAFTAMRSLGAPAWIAPALVVLTQASWILSPAWEQWFTTRDPRANFRATGIAAFFSLLIVAAVEVRPLVAGEGRGEGQVTLFVIALVLFYAVQAGYLAQRGALLRANYGPLIRGSVYGMLTIVSRITSIVSAKAAGFMLDGDPRLLRVVFPLAGALSLAEQWKLARIRWRRGGRRGRARAAGPGFRASWKRGIDVLREDANFRTYQIAFSLYGLGFLMCTPLVVVFGERDLGVSYGEWTWAQGVASPVAGLVTVAIFGRMVDTLGVVRLTALSFVLVAAYLAWMPFVTTGGQLVGVFALFGVSMAAVNIVWNVGPVAFAPEGKGREYAAAHVLLVGVRSVVAPPLGFLLASLTSLQFAFGTGAAIVLCGAFTAWRLSKRTGLR